MRRIEKIALVPYTAQQMYQLVNDVEHYSDFIPWCASSHIENHTESEMQATLVLEHSGVKQSFTTKNTLFPFEKIKMTLEKGPFKHLNGEWRFEPRSEGGCQVCLQLDFEFSSGLMGMLFGPFFEKAANKLVDSFCQRANEVYGVKNLL